MKTDLNVTEIVETCLLAGKIMLQSGAETHRVEDTMQRMAHSFGVTGSQSYVTPTGIIFSTEGTEPTNFLRISERSTDLHKIAAVNNISRKISSGDLSLSIANEKLKKLDVESQTYPLFIQVIAAALVSGCFTIMFQGSWPDFIPAMTAGGIGFYAMVRFHNLVEIRFFAEFLASLIIGLLSFLFINAGVGAEIDKIIIGAVMPLVPGLLITNAVRDLMAGHLVAGLSKGAEAFLTAFAIGAGIAVGFSFL
ncbi:threonine/serine exporter family protein [Sediminibacillus massiliensis]|uniref:threonine/serine exporter family protein n=1 Tax=Sediminibacillus massiliensis TaxID=1926277 RepID=UPI00098854EB|nr:threonine/serine exporter family protein [Sediminibacillus massiliensis]